MQNVEAVEARHALIQTFCKNTQKRRWYVLDKSMVRATFEYRVSSASVRTYM